MKHLLEQGLLSKQQFGFIPHRSTADAILGLTNALYEAANKEMVSAIIFVDLKKAFNTINHAILIDKLHSCGMSPNSLEWFGEYLRQRRECTVANGLTSDALTQEYGVPQGSVLGPLLFLCYINQVGNEVQHGLNFMYADDLAIVVSCKDVHRLQALIQEDANHLTAWFNKNKLSINTEKTYVMWCHSPRKPLNTDLVPVHMNGRRLTAVLNFNYLGVHIDRFRSLATQGNKIVGLVRRRLDQLYHIRANTDAATTYEVYITMIRPIMEYCSFIIDGGPAWLAPKLQVLQNDALRICEKIRNAQDAHVDDLHEL